MKDHAALKRISNQCLNNLAARFSCHFEPFDKLRAGPAALVESAAALSEAQSAKPNGKAQSRNLSLLAGRRAKFREQ
jgi:hypothetical protein